MTQIVLIGISAGAASAFLFASIASGTLLAVPLFYLAPLPILIAAIGWSHLAGLIAAIFAAGALAAVLGGFFFVSFLVGVGLPAWWLGYLALLARPTGPNPADLEWYPIGQLVLWAALLAGALVTMGMLAIGTDAEAFRSGLRESIERMMGSRADAAPRPNFRVPGMGETDTVGFIVMVAPPTAAVVATLTNLVSLWLAGRIVNVSGRLRRPWPNLSDLRFPPIATLLLAAAIVAALMPDMIGIIGGVFTATLLTAFAVLGLAVTHAITRSISGRGFVLGAVYGAIFVFGWPVLLMSLIGLTDSLLNLRQRVGPPPPAGKST